MFLYLSYKNHAVMVASFDATDFYNLTQQSALVASFDATGFYTLTQQHIMASS